MSDPMTTHEIEDVLSSIRRLVSDDLRPTPRTDPSPKSAETVMPEGKLLLTPALRVVVDGDAGDDVAAVTPHPLPEAGSVVTRLGFGVIDDDWESPTGDVEDWPDTSLGGDRPTLHFVHRTRDDADAADTPIDHAIHADIVDDDDDTSWADQAEADVMADLAQELSGDVTAAMPGDAMLFDEEVLRDLVRDLIREELAGSLGERITRNVRKLVRAEVARALAMRELD